MSENPRNELRRGSLLHMRNGVVLADYGDTRISSDDYGNGFKAALAAMQSGDVLECSPIVATLVDATCSVDGVCIKGNGIELKRKTSTNYAHIFKTTGIGNEISNLTANGTNNANTGTGYGVHVTGDRTHLDGVKAKGTNGTTPNNGDGSGIKIDYADFVRVDNCESHNAEYAGLWLNTADHVFVKNFYSYNSVERSLSINAAADTELIDIDGFVGIADTNGCHSGWNQNIYEGYLLNEFRIKNVKLIDTDMISSGVSYNSASGYQMMKLQNTKAIFMEDVKLHHGTNAGAGGQRSIYWQDVQNNVAPDLLSMKNVSCSDAIVLSMRMKTWLMQACRVGYRSCQASSLIYTMSCDRFRAEECEFDLHTAGNYLMTLDVGDFNANDRYEFIRSTFKANSASNRYIAHRNLSPGSYASIDDKPGTIYVDPYCKFSNTGGGAFTYGNDQTATDIMSVDLRKADKTVSETASHNLASRHIDKLVLVNSGSTVTITINNDTSLPNVPIGAKVSYYRQGTGAVTIAAGTATVVSAGAKLSAQSQYSVITIRKVAASTWVVTEDRV